MPLVSVNGINISYNQYGIGDPVVLVAGSAARGSIWTVHQVPALCKAGYQVITLDNRGIPPTDICPEGFTVYDMAADVAGLIEALKLGPCHVVGCSLGAMIVQELILARPELVTRAVMMSTRGRVDELRAAMAAADDDLWDSGVVLPSRYAAVLRALHYLSPQTQNNERRIRDWLDVFEMSPPEPSLVRSHRRLDLIGDRLEEYRKIVNECLVIGFDHDLITPPYLCREVAEHIPDCMYETVSGCGHYGYLEEPDVVNSLIIEFFGKPLRCELLRGGKAQHCRSMSEM